MTSKNPDNESSSDSNSEESPVEDQSPEAIAAAAIKAAKASVSADAKTDDNSIDDKSADESDAPVDAESGDGQSNDEGNGDSDLKDVLEGEVVDKADPLGFDDARMPESEGDEVDLSAEGTDAEAEAEPDPVAELAAANAKADEHWNRVLRMQADLENERKRTQKQVANAHKFAIEGFVNEMLPIKDSLEMGLIAAKADDADLTKIVEGSELTLKLLAQAFEKFQITEVDPLDEKFDPNVHQAMSMQEAEGKEANIVIGVMQKGYTLNERLIRPALVTVSK